MESNKNRVPKKQWRRWSEPAQVVFNRTYEFAMRNPELMVHPKALVVRPACWKTTAWNMAWIAADAVDDCIPDEVVEVESGCR